MEINRSKARSMGHDKAGATSAIPCASIDPEMQSLIRAMNSVDGIETLGCCAGHKPTQAELDYYEGYVIFRARDLGSVVTLFSTFPAGVSPLHPGLAWCPKWVRGWCQYNGEDGLLFGLSFGGYPREEQRRLLVDSGIAITRGG